jgi:Fe-S oxidoreductase
MDADSKQKLITVIGERLNRAVRMYMENCSRCGTCIESCHAYASTKDIRYSPVGRAQNIRRLFEKYCSRTGDIAPWLNAAEEIDDIMMDKVYETAFTCTGCRRCMVKCPFGIDTQQIQAIAKSMLIAAETDPIMLRMRAKGEIEKAEKIDTTKSKLGKEVEKISAELIEKYPGLSGKEVIPLDASKADTLYVSMTEKPSIMPAAAIFNAAEENWCLSIFEAVNFGAFLGSPEMTKQIYMRIVSEAEKLGIKKVVICECGTAFRLMKHMIGETSFEVITLLEQMDRYLQDGRIQVEKNRIEGRITYHDPCQIARNSGVYQAPRNCLRAISDNFVEMSPNRSMNWCCGGGGGLVIAQEPEFRMMTSRVKADQLRATGADITATACEMCLAQLLDLSDDFELDMEIKLVSDLVAECLIME